MASPNQTPALAEVIQPLAFLLGTWTGAGDGRYSTIAPFRFEHELTITTDGRPFLQSLSRTWILDERGVRVRPGATELGFWRAQPDGGAELVLALPTGIAEIYVGRVANGRAELATQTVARTPSAKEVTAGRRIYALRGRETEAGEGAEELRFTHDMATVGQPLQRHLESRLRRHG